MNLERKLNIIGDIDENSYKEFIEQLDAYEEILQGDDVTIELMSHGGDAQVALAFYNRIRNIKGNVTIYAYGIIASAAVLILAAGDKRIMAKDAWVMVHEDTTTISDTDRVKSVERQAIQARNFESQWNIILASRTKISAKTWDILHQEESYLTSSDCLKYGLIHKII